MKKIMFNDRFGLTQAVIEGRKTQTRRIVKPQPVLDERLEMICTKAIAYGRGMTKKGTYQNFIKGTEHDPLFRRFRKGEIVAVAQSYLTCYYSFSEETRLEMASNIEQFSAARNNKMFVKADLMPYKIKITSVKLEQLQDISNEDCMKEGVLKALLGYYINGLKVKNWEEEAHRETEEGCLKLFTTPREAYAKLIDAISGKGTWEANPFVYVYDFKLV